ncbi:hypothetical protein B0H19DRAFT_1091892 [Mycena capillaripes]|nr:hypothetical protein B0H19DRAFT_1091892 [Mycena capillaripes]
MLRTATRLARRPQNAALGAQSRPSSSAVAHDADDHPHHHEKDDTVYPKEGFGAPIWRKTLVCTIGAALFYDDKPWVPATSTETLVDIASTRAAKEDVMLQERQLVRSATRPKIYRSRNPEDFNHISPYGNPVGMSVDWSKPSRIPALPATLEEARRARKSE